MNKKNQSGFAHLLVLTVILGLAVVGLLGYVLYQNLNPKKDNVVKTDESSMTKEKDDIISDKDTGAVPASTAGYAVLDDWSVKFKLPTNLGKNEIRYQKAPSGGASTSGAVDAYQFSTSDIESIGKGCTLANYPTGIIHRVSNGKDAPLGDFVATIGDYSYYTNRAMSTCSDDQVELQVRDTNIVGDLLKSVEKK